MGRYERVYIIPGIIIKNGIQSKQVYTKNFTKFFSGVFFEFLYTINIIIKNSIANPTDAYTAVHFDAQPNPIEMPPRKRGDINFLYDMFSPFAHLRADSPNMYIK